MINILQQHFLPASKGLVRSSPSSLIADGAFQDVNNVRFADGYVEKVQGFVQIGNAFDEGIIHIGLMKKTTGDILNLIHTKTKLYSITADKPNGVNIMPDNAYNVSGFGYISSRTIFDNYIFCSLGNDIMYWDGKTEKCSKLHGTYKPSSWVASKAYVVGDIVKPTDSKYTGYIYICTQTGTSATTEPTWQKDLSSAITDDDVRWKGIGGLEIEGNSATSLQAKCIENYKGFVFLANTTEDGTEYPHRIRWSQWQNPFLWHNNTDSSGMAGYVDVDDSAGVIYAIRRLGDYLYVYKEDGLFVISYTGGDTVFSKESVTTKAGLVGPTALVELPHEHIFIARDNIYSFDGSTVTPIGDAVKQYVMSIIDPAKLQKIYGYYNTDSEDVIFAFDSITPHGDNRDKAIIYNTSTKTWSMRDMNITAVGEFSQISDKVIDDVSTLTDDDSEIIDSSLYAKDKLVTIAGDASGELYRLGGYYDSRGDYNAFVVSKVHHMNAPELVKRLMRVMFHIETQGDYPLRVRVGYGWNAEAPMQWTPELTMDLRAPKPPWVDVDLSARYFVVKFGTDSNSQPFKVLGYTLFYQARSET